MQSRSLLASLALTVCGISFGQIYPQDAHVNLYFPHLADGGTGAQRWQTRFTFVNPSATRTAYGALLTYADDGTAWNIDLGYGPHGQLNFTIPPQGRLTLVSKVAEPNITTGWATAYADLPLQGTVAFRALSGAAPTLDLTAPATLPSSLYRSAANSKLGIALANVYGVSMSVVVRALDQNGATVGSGQVNLPPVGHRSFNLNQLIPSLPANFLGSVEMAPTSLGWQFLGWTANEDSGMLSTLPAGRAEWPISQYDRLWLVFLRVLDAAGQLYPQVTFNGPQGLAQGAVELTTPFIYIDPKTNQPVFNAVSYLSGEVRIPYSVSELISDSPSEIAFIVAHELGHQIQYRLGKLQFSSNPENDADVYGLILSMDAGFDPYAAGGALGKLAMATGSAGLQAQAQADWNVVLGVDPHMSWGDRINSLWGLLKAACGSAASTCAQYKSLIHPDFPPATPLLRAPKESIVLDGPMARPGESKP